MNTLKKLLPQRLVEGLRYIRHGRLSWEHSCPSSSIAAGMTTAEEQALFKKSAKDVAHLRGEIVDLGCWLGSTTISMAMGLREGGDQGKIHAFDLFKWDPWMDSFSKDHWCDYRAGESFLPEARRRIGEFSPWVDLIEADLITFQWKSGPIRLLLVDAMKSWKLCESIAKSFYPSLIPGALLVHQDYQCYNTSWIPILQYRLRDCFRFVQGVRKGGTVAFETLRTPRMDELEAATRQETVTVEEVAAAIKYSADPLEDHGKASMSGSHVHYLAKMGRKAEALEQAKRYENEGVPLKGGFARAIEEAQMP
jgi:hypothetical protein